MLRTTKQPLVIPAREIRPYDVIGGLRVARTSERENTRTGVREPILTLDSGARLIFPDPVQLVKVTSRRLVRPTPARRMRADSRPHGERGA